MQAKERNYKQRIVGLEQQVRTSAPGDAEFSGLCILVGARWDCSYLLWVSPHLPSLGADSASIYIVIDIVLSPL